MQFEGDSRYSAVMTLKKNKNFLRWILNDQQKNQNDLKTKIKFEKLKPH